MDRSAPRLNCYGIVMALSELLWSAVGARYEYLCRAIGQIEFRNVKDVNGDGIHRAYGVERTY